MENCSLQSSTITTIPTSLNKRGFIEKPSIHGQFLKFPNFSRFPYSRKLKILDIKAQTSVAAKFSSEAVPKEVETKDENLAFVAGATGKVGSRAVRELLKLGFRVRAGVRSAQKAEALVQSAKEMKLDVEGSQPVERLEIVECDLEKPNQIGPALGNASVVLCCIGASEKEVFDVTGPCRIDYRATKNLIDAGKVLCNATRKAEEALIASGVPYTIVRPGGMERPTDAYKETHNITLSEEDTLFGGQVSNLQVAELMAFMAKNRGLSYCKVVEVIAETTAPLTPMDELLAKIPSQRVEPKKSDVSEVPKPLPPKIVEPVAPSSPSQKEPSQANAMVTRPLSPYTAQLKFSVLFSVAAMVFHVSYDDLRPPTSPTPTQPSGKKDSVNLVEAVSKPDTSHALPAINETKPAPVETKTTRPLSPFTAMRIEYPSYNFSQVVLKCESLSSSSKSYARSHIDGFRSSLQFIPHYRFRYDDLKPPTSPSPTAPAGSIVPTSSINAVPTTDNGASPTAAAIDKQHHAEPKPKPLSPYPALEASSISNAVAEAIECYIAELRSLSVLQGRNVIRIEPKKELAGVWFVGSTSYSLVPH
ncbi:unnamed protein product [Dovyalis caffra]|uniref:NAD(P)-binding domain-containing protein n=1 Tax=Dovyalis caffra TaxID=77055 RepID=A0AAV1R8Q2_9ROSI|nr:unnamed protein product [Dovyalis caffra]